MPPAEGWRGKAARAASDWKTIAAAVLMVLGLLGWAHKRVNDVRAAVEAVEHVQANRGAIEALRNALEAHDREEAERIRQAYQRIHLVRCDVLQLRPVQCAALWEDGAVIPAHAPGEGGKD